MSAQNIDERDKIRAALYAGKCDGNLSSVRHKRVTGSTIHTPTRSLDQRVLKVEKC